jgi:hypothetical protein
MAPHQFRAMREALIYRPDQERLVQALPTICGNREGVPQETDTGRDLHVDLKIKGRDLRTGIGDGKPDPRLNFIVRANGIKGPMPGGEPTAVAIDRRTAQGRHTFANALIPFTRQNDPTLRELRRFGWAPPDEEAPGSATNLISECPVQPTKIPSEPVHNHPISFSRGPPPATKPRPSPGIAQ